MIRQRPRAGSEEEGSVLKRIFTLRLSLLSLIGLGSVSLVAVAWVFALGVIVGRGFAPEDKLPTLGRLVPEVGDAAEEDNREIIKAEDLTFLHDLKSQPTLSTEDPAPDSAPAPRREAPAAAVQPPAASPEPQVQTDAPKPASSERYNYVFQVIAYKKPEQADSFRDKLEQAGLRTRLSIERDKQGKARFYRIQVLVHGTEQDAEAVKAVLLRHGIKDPFLASRKPAGR